MTQPFTDASDIISIEDDLASVRNFINLIQMASCELAGGPGSAIGEGAGAALLRLEHARIRLSKLRSVRPCPV